MSAKEMEVWKLQRAIIPNILKTKNISLLKKINGILTIIHEQEIIGRTVDGKPLTRKKMEEDLKKALDDVKNGDVLSFEELVAESENW